MVNYTISSEPITDAIQWAWYHGGVVENWYLELESFF